MSSLAASGSYLLAAVLAGDALISVKPPKFIRRCLEGVKFPADWWWTLIAIKSLAATGLVYGAATGNASVATTVSVGVLGYFLSAIIAHIKANFLGSEFWINCLGMTALSAGVLSFNAKSM